MRRARWLPFVALIALGAELGCERQAPGPDECARFAETVAGARRDSPFLTAEMQATIDVATRECLTEPYDHALLNCVIVTRQTRACLDAFRRRTGRRR